MHIEMKRMDARYIVTFLILDKNKEEKEVKFYFESCAEAYAFRSAISIKGYLLLNNRPYKVLEETYDIEQEKLNEKDYSTRL